MPRRWVRRGRASLESTSGHLVKPCYVLQVLPLKASVRNGRLVLDEPTELPEGAVVDLVAIDSTNRKIRFGSCKRNPAELLGSFESLKGNAARFVEAQRSYADWDREYALIAPMIEPQLKAEIAGRGAIAEDLNALLEF